METKMKTINKTELNLLDDIYSIAYWMTGDQSISEELVKKTYRYAAPILEQSVLLKTFRDCYIGEYGQMVDLWFCEKAIEKNVHLTASQKQSAADIKFSVLLSEISGLDHQQISHILDKPIDTIRGWLFCGRKLFLDNYLFKASA